MSQLLLSYWIRSMETPKISNSFFKKYDFFRNYNPNDIFCLF